MKKLVLSISMFLIAATTFAQSEVVTDSIPPISLDGYKNFNGFMLDMGSMIVAPPPPSDSPATLLSALQQ